MKRKIGKVGLSSLIITLPNRFVKRNNLKKGDEIDIQDNGHKLTVRAKVSQESANEAFIDISNLDTTLIWRYILAAYKNGHSIIKIKYDNTKITTKGRLKRSNIEFIDINDLMKDISNLLIGMEIISNSSDLIVLKEIAVISDKEFVSSLRRIIYILKNMITDIIDSKSDIRNKLVNYDVNINKLTNYCIRIISRSEKYRNKGYVLLINLLEQLGDQIKELPVDMMKKESNKILNLLSMNLDIINTSFSSVEKKQILEYYNNCDQLKDLSMETQEKDKFLQIKDSFREIGQVLIEGKFKVPLN